MLANRRRARRREGNGRHERRQPNRHRPRVPGPGSQEPRDLDSDRPNHDCLNGGAVVIALGWVLQPGFERLATPIGPLLGRQSWVLVTPSVATALLFPVAARALGSRALVRDAVAGIVFAVAVDLLFTRVLAVPLPIGLVGF